MEVWVLWCSWVVVVWVGMVLGWLWHGMHSGVRLLLQNFRADKFMEVQLNTHCVCGWMLLWFGGGCAAQLVACKADCDSRRKSCGQTSSWRFGDVCFVCYSCSGVVVCGMQSSVQQQAQKFSADELMEVRVL
jgi:Na+/phosphate symporter